MAVQAHQCVSHAFYPHDLGHAFGGGGVLLDALGAGGIGDAVFGGEAQQRSELTCNGNDDGGFLPRKRPRVASAAPGLQQEGAGGPQGLALPPLAVPQGQVFFTGDVLQSSRALGCGAAASTSGRRAAVSQGVISLLYSQEVEIDALVRLQMERMRLGLQEAHRRHLLRAMVVVAADRASSAGRLRAAEAELERARCRNAELEELVRQTAAEVQAWAGVARSHEDVAASLRATLDQLLLLPAAAALADADDGEGAAAEDAQSCCFETAAGVADNNASSWGGGAPSSCKSCRGAGEPCVLLLPCRHLCLCRACEAVATSCPVCAATVNGSLQVLLS